MYVCNSDINTPMSSDKFNLFLSNVIFASQGKGMYRKPFASEDDPSCEQ